MDNPKKRRSPPTYELSRLLEDVSITTILPRSESFDRLQELVQVPVATRLLMTGVNRRDYKWFYNPFSSCWFTLVAEEDLNTVKQLLLHRMSLVPVCKPSAYRQCVLVLLFDPVSRPSKKVKT